MLSAEFGTGQFVFWMLWFFLWVLWIYLLFYVFADIFRSPDLSGWGKALWMIFVIVVPYVGVLVYLITRGHRMQARLSDRPATGRGHEPVRAERHGQPGTGPMRSRRTVLR